MHSFHIGHAAKFAQCEQLDPVELGFERLPVSRKGVGRIGGVSVHTDNINDIIARIPIGVFVRQNPDEVVQVVIGGQPVEEQPPELLEGAGTFGPPPEPAARGFMQRAPQNRNVIGGNFLQLRSDRIDVAQDEGIFNGIGVGQRRRDVKGRRGGVKAAPPRFVRGIEQVGRGVPVPHQSQHVPGALEGDIAFRVISRQALVLHAAGGVINQIALYNRRFEPGFPLDVADLG